MKEVIEKKIAEITEQMERLQCQHLYWMREDWKILNGKRETLAELLTKIRKRNGK